MCYILWDGVIKTTCKDVGARWLVETVGMVEYHLLHGGQRNLARDRVLVAEKDFSKDFATLNERAGNLHAGTAAKTKVSDRDRRVHEDCGVCRYVLDDKEVGGLCQLLNRQVRLLSCDRTKSHEGTMVVNDLIVVSISNITTVVGAAVRLTVWWDAEPASW